MQKVLEGYMLIFLILLETSSLSDILYEIRQSWEPIVLGLLLLKTVVDQIFLMVILLALILGSTLMRNLAYFGKRT